MAKHKKIIVNGAEINITSEGDKEYISLTDMVKNMEDGSKLIENWLRSKNTLEYLAAWESLHNAENFNSPEFEGIRTEAGTNRFLMSVTQWVKRTQAIGIRSKSGRYGGTEAHADIAFHFAMWISPMFQLLVVKEFQNLKQREALGHSQHWDMRRFISKANYTIQTDAIKYNLIPLRNLPKDKEGIVYAEEAEVLNYALFGISSKEWRLQNPKLTLHGENLRDYANTHQLIVLANIQSLNAELIKSNIPQAERIKILRNSAISQLNSLKGSNLPETMLIESPLALEQSEKKTEPLSEHNQKLKQALNYNPKDKGVD